MIRAARTLVAIACVLAGVSAHAEPAYPSKPIQMIVAYPPGGGTDILARLIAAELARELGQPVVVNNRPGASGNIGTEAAARATPDGYTLLMATANVTINPAVDPKTRYRPTRDFVPVTLLSDSPFVLIATPAMPAGSLKELFNYSQTNTGKLNYASTGNGSPQHVAGELLKRTAGIDWLHVPYQGGAPALADVAAGRVQVMFSNALPAFSYIKSARVKAIAVTTRERLPALPDVPTMAEQGQTDFVIGFWSGVLAPKGTPAPIVTKLNDALIRIINMPSVRETLAQQGSIVAPLPSEQFGEYIKEDAARWENMVKTSGVTAAN